MPQAFHFYPVFILHPSPSHTLSFFFFCLSLLPWQAFFPCSSSLLQSFNWCFRFKQSDWLTVGGGCIWGLLGFTIKVLCRKCFWDIIRCIKTPISSYNVNEKCTATVHIWQTMGTVFNGPLSLLALAWWKWIRYVLW